MPLNKYLDDGLDAFMLSNPKATDAQLENEALRLEAEYNTQTAPQQNVERAKAMVANDPVKLAQLQAMQQGPEAFLQKIRQQGIKSLPYGDRYKSNITGQPRSATSAKILEATTPRIAQGMAKGGNFQPLGGMQDIASLPARALTSGVDPSKFLDRMSQTENTGFISDVIRDPMNVIPGTGGVVGKGLPLAKRALQTAKSGIMSQIPTTMLTQAGNIESGKGFSAGETAGEITAGGFLPVAFKGLKKTFTPIKEFTKDVMSEASGRSKELLNTIGGRELKEWARKSYLGEDAKPDQVLEKLRNFSDNAELIANNVIETVDNFDVLYKEKNEVIDKALNIMPDMDALPLMQKLEQSKLRVPRHNKKGFGGEIAFNNQIDGLINRIKDKVNQNNPVELGQLGINERQRTFISPHDMLDIRRDIDKSINWDAETFSNAFYNPIQALKKDSRTYIKDLLENTSESIGDESYTPAMKEYSKMLDLQDKVKRNIMPRSNDIGKVDRATNFLLRLSSPNKIDQKIFAKQFEKILGKDLFEEADFLRLSKEYRDALPIANDIKTGRKNWLQGFTNTTGGKIATAPFSSPKIAAPIMGGIDFAEKGLQKYSPGLAEVANKVKPVVTEQYIGE